MFYGFHHLFLAIFFCSFQRTVWYLCHTFMKNRLPRKQNEEIWGKLTHRKVKPKMRWVISTLASEMFSVFGLGLDSWTFHGRTEHQILQSAAFPKPNRTLHEHCCCTFRKSRQICQRTPTFLRKHVWYVPEFMRDMCTAVHSKQLIFNF